MLQRGSVCVCVCVYVCVCVCVHGHTCMHVFVFPHLCRLCRFPCNHGDTDIEMNPLCWCSLRFCDTESSNTRPCLWSGGYHQEQQHICVIFLEQEHAFFAPRALIWHKPFRSNLSSKKGSEKDRVYPFVWPFSYKSRSNLILIVQEHSNDSQQKDLRSILTIFSLFVSGDQEGTSFLSVFLTFPIWPPIVLCKKTLFDSLLLNVPPSKINRWK